MESLDLESTLVKLCKSAKTYKTFCALQRLYTYMPGQKQNSDVVYYVNYITAAEYFGFSRPMAHGIMDGWDQVKINRKGSLTCQTWGWRRLGDKSYLSTYLPDRSVFEYEHGRQLGTKMAQACADSIT